MRITNNCLKPASQQTSLGTQEEELIGVWRHLARCFCWFPSFRGEDQTSNRVVSEWRIQLIVFTQDSKPVLSLPHFLYMDEVPKPIVQVSAKSLLYPSYFWHFPTWDFKHWLPAKKMLRHTIRAISQEGKNLPATPLCMVICMAMRGMRR